MVAFNVGKSCNLSFVYSTFPNNKKCLGGMVVDFFPANVPRSLFGRPVVRVSVIHGLPLVSLNSKMADEVDQSEVESFVRSHMAQLVTSKIPSKYWSALCAKLKNEVQELYMNSNVLIIPISLMCAA